VRGGSFVVRIEELKDQPGNEATGEIGDDVYPDLREIHQLHEGGADWPPRG